MSIWDNISEQVLGLVISERLNKNLIRPEMFSDPYNEMAEDFLSGMKKEELFIKHSGIFDSVIFAAENVTTDLDWIATLQQAKSSYLAGILLERAGRKLIYGDKPDLTKLKETITKLEVGENIDIFKPANTIVARKIKFVPSGWEAFDEHLGGLPPQGLIPIEGNPGSGKTTMALQFCKHHVKTKPTTAVVFSMEMTEEETKLRLEEIDMKLTDEEFSRILILDEIISPHKAVNLLATLDNVGLVIVDYAEYACSALGKINEENMTQTFKIFTNAAKTLKLPIMLLCQPNKMFTGGIPRPNDVYYTGSALKDAWLFISIYNPNTSSSYEDKDRDIMMLRDGQASAVIWKCRGGFEKHPNTYPGGIVLGYKGRRGFSPMSLRPHWIHVKS